MVRRILAVVLLAGVTVITQATPTLAAAGTGGRCRVHNVQAGTGGRGWGANLQRAIDRAERGDTLEVRGTCHGSFVLRTHLTLVGVPTPRYPRAKLDGDDAGRVLEVLHGGELRSLVLRDGQARYGGAILSRSGWLRLTGDTRVRGSRAGRGGGGIQVRSGRVVLADRTVVLRNVGKITGGGVHVLTPGRLVIRDDAQVRANRSHGDGGGVSVDIGTVTLRNRAWVHGNWAGGSGGGIANLDGWSWFWGRARVTDNTAEKEGGGVFVYFGSGGVCSPHVQLSPNTPDDPPFEIGC